MKHERFVFKNISQFIQGFQLPEDRDLYTEVESGEYVSVCVDEKFQWAIAFLKCNHMKYIGKITVEETDTEFFIGNNRRQLVKWR